MQQVCKKLQKTLSSGLTKKLQKISQVCEKICKNFAARVDKKLYLI